MTTAHSGLGARIAADIRAQIRDGNLLPGGRLPAMTELRRAYRCSSTPVREAMIELRLGGWIREGRAGGPARVVDDPPARVVDPGTAELARVHEAGWQHFTDTLTAAVATAIEQGFREVAERAERAIRQAHRDSGQPG